MFDLRPQRLEIPIRQFLFRKDGVHPLARKKRLGLKKRRAAIYAGSGRDQGLLERVTVIGFPGDN
jgi:hypothetical protein